LIVINGLQRAFPGSKVTPEEVKLDPATLQITAGGSAATQALPATRIFFPATGPTTRRSGPSTRHAAHAKEDAQ